MNNEYVFFLILRIMLMSTESLVLLNGIQNKENDSIIILG